MADASVHILLNVDFKDTYQTAVKNADGLTEIRNCHLNVGFKGELRWDSSKPDGTLRKLTDVTKLHNLGWHHSIEIEEGVSRLYRWYCEGL